MEIIYQVLPRNWGKGKFSDWNAGAFRYLQSLQVTAVWFTGVIRHASGKPYVKGDPGSPYSIEDYFDVNPYLADEPQKRMQEFCNLVRRTHAAGLKVILDYIPNHVSPDCKDLPKCDHCDYDWTDTLKVDYSHPDTWKKMLGIVEFWAGKGVDGLRCDMVEMVPPEFLKWLIAKVKKKHHGFIFIGEVYNRDNYRRYVRELGFDLLYDKSGFYDNVRAIIRNGASARNLTRNWQFLQDLQPNMLNFLENHDEQRFASPYFAGDPIKAFPAIAVGALFNKASFMIYSGQEFGEDAADGDEGRTSIFNWTHRIDYKHLGPVQLKVLKKCRELLSLLTLPQFRDGEVYDLCWCNSILYGFDPEKHFAFLRYKRLPRKRKADATLVVCSFSSEPVDMKINFPEDLRLKKELSWLPQRLGVRLAAPYEVYTMPLTSTQ